MITASFSIDDCPPFPQGKDVEMRHCLNHVGFAVDSVGDVWSCWRRGGWRGNGGRNLGVHWKRRKLAQDSGGYLCVCIRTTVGTLRTRLVHQLVLEAFVGPKPPGCESRHLDGNRTNASLVNLVWGTRSENRMDSARHGTLSALRRGEKAPAAKLSDADVVMMRKLYAWLTPMEIAKLFRVSRGHTKDIVRKRARTVA